MNPPKTSEDFILEFYHSIDLIDTLGDLRIRQFITRLEKVDDTIIFNGIIKTFEDTSREKTLYLDQKYAGIILQKINPKTEIDLTYILNSTIANWNKSVEEFPFWIKENYGMINVKAKIIDFERQDLSDLQKDKIKTIKWWLQI
ncbi:hypothetical protein [Flavobacterium sp. HNIBRBA15423]|uniref:hypothetical protein n=1 Tax=Flavobacterium sp. HNIBRBA15423 TaxID=3458683 RepID=UPI004043C4E3